MIYMDSAATSFYRPKEVAQAVYEAIHTMGNAGRGGHESALQASRIIYETRVLLSELFGASGADRIAFTGNATEALNMAIAGVSGEGVRMAATAMDHNSVLRPMYMAQKRGAQLKILGADKQGRISLDELEELLKKGLDVFACTHASNLTGNKNDIGQIGAMCRNYGVTFLVDASQSAGILPIDMEKDSIDILCFTGHKGLMGPQGTGGICLGKEMSLPPWKTGGTGIQSYLKEQPSHMPEVLEAGTLNAHGIAGLHAALQYIKNTGVQTIREKENRLMEQFYQGVKDMDAVQVYGDFTEIKERAPIVALNIGDLDSSEVSDELAQIYEIQTRPGAHCAPLMHEALGTKKQGAVRFSFSHFLTEEDVQKAIFGVQRIREEAL